MTRPVLVYKDVVPPLLEHLGIEGDNLVSLEIKLQPKPTPLGYGPNGNTLVYGHIVVITYRTDTDGTPILDHLGPATRETWHTLYETGEDRS